MRRLVKRRLEGQSTDGGRGQAGKGSATLSMAYAAAAFAESCLKAMAGEGGVTDYAYVESSVVDGLPFFASKVRCGAAVSVARHVLHARPGLTHGVRDNPVGLKCCDAETDTGSILKTAMCKYSEDSRRPTGTLCAAAHACQGAC